jgi:hypothetical protein
MTTPGPRPGYLEEAASELRKARADNEKRAAELDDMEAKGHAADRAPVNDRRLQIAGGFIALAAIEEGVDTGGYGPAVALQDLDVRIIGDDGEPR